MLPQPKTNFAYDPGSGTESSEAVCGAYLVLGMGCHSIHRELFNLILGKTLNAV